MSPEAPSSNDRAERARDLKEAALFVDSVNPRDPLSLSDIRDVIGRFEKLRTTVLAVGAVRDTRARAEVRRLLREMRVKGDVLSGLATEKASKGEPDDGGEIPPSQRDNICKAIDRMSNVGAEFRDSVKSLCSALDTIRAKVRAGQSQEAAVSVVATLMEHLKTMDEYSQPQVAWRLAQMLGEECRWLDKQPVPLTGVPSDFGPSQAVVSTQGGPNSFLDPDARARGIEEAYEYAITAIPDERLTLGFLRTQVLRLELYKEMIADFIKLSDTATLSRIREVLGTIKVKVDALKAAAKEREASGETDDGETDLPSLRNNICRNLDGIGLAKDLHVEVKLTCDALDMIRQTAIFGGDQNATMMLVAERMQALRSRPGYEKLSIAGELEIIFAEEWHWVKSHELAKAALAAKEKEGDS